LCAARQPAKPTRRPDGAECVATPVPESPLPHSVLRQSRAPREMVAHLEAGKIEPRSDLIEHIAAALGRRLRDFAEE